MALCTTWKHYLSLFCRIDRKLWLKCIHTKSSHNPNKSSKNETIIFWASLSVLLCMISGPRVPGVSQYRRGDIFIWRYISGVRGTQGTLITLSAWVSVTRQTFTQLFVGDSTWSHSHTISSQPLCWRIRGFENSWSRVWSMVKSTERRIDVVFSGTSLGFFKELFSSSSLSFGDQCPGARWIVWPPLHQEK